MPKFLLFFVEIEAGQCCRPAGNLELIFYFFPPTWFLWHNSLTDCVRWKENPIHRASVQMLTKKTQELCRTLMDYLGLENQSRIPYSSGGSLFGNHKTEVCSSHSWGTTCGLALGTEPPEHCFREQNGAVRFCILLSGVFRRALPLPAGLSLSRWGALCHHTCAVTIMMQRMMKKYVVPFFPQTLLQCSIVGSTCWR